MSTFRRNESGEIQIAFTSQEAQVLVNLTEQMLELLGESELATSAPDLDDQTFMNLMGISTSDSPPEDPVLRRLFPNAYQDEQEASEFRRYTEHGLREKKRAHAFLIRESLSESGKIDEIEWSDVNSLDRSLIELIMNDGEASAWLGGLNDLRLALAVRLGIGEKNLAGESEERSTSFELMTDSDPMKAVYSVYSWLGWVQQSLLEVLMASGDEHQAT
ncbi:MAG: hypothetical protein RLZZ527_782 [Actinomycetota bacterium]|jgi:hypothetical protein